MSHLFKTPSTLFVVALANFIYKLLILKYMHEMHVIYKNNALYSQTQPPMMILNEQQFDQLIDT